MKEARNLSREFRLSALARMEAGENVAVLARELGVRRKLLHDWRDAFEAGGADALRGRGRPRKGAVVVGARDKRPEKPKKVSGTELQAARRRIAELERKVGQQALEADFFRQALQLLENARRTSGRSSETSVYGLIQAWAQRQGGLSVERMCEMAGVSRAGYYRHFRRASPSEEEVGLRDQIQRLALAHRHYGYRRITALLHREGWQVNHKRVNRLMREDNLLCLRRRGFVPATTDSTHRYPIYPNLARKLVPMAINQLWVADLTYARLSASFAYLAVILDAYSRLVIGYGMATHLKAELALQALEMAFSKREVISGGLVHHSDRGVQYTCNDYIGRLNSKGVVPSMSRIGCPYDNAMVESFMKTLKTEQVEGQIYRDLSHAQSDITGFIEQVYNR